MRKNKIESRPVKTVPAPAPKEPIIGRCEFNQPKKDSWTYQNFGPGGYIDAHGVPCRSDWY